MADRFYFDQTILNRASDMRLDDPWQIGSNKFKPVFIPIWNDKSLIFEKSISFIFAWSLMGMNVGTG